jgi:predicted acylesterase/phospholipase RssA
MGRTKIGPAALGGLALLALGSAPPGARAADRTPPAREALDRIANTHPDGSAVLRGKRWDAGTVARLASWVRGDAAAASKDDVALLRDELSRPVSLSVSGAVSLGNYQGGYLYYYLRALAEARKLGARLEAATGERWGPGQASPLSLVTGASSGSINAFIAAIVSCQEPVLAPRESLFWKTWFPVSGDALQEPAGATPTGLLSVAPVEKAVDRVKTAFRTGAWSPDACAVDVGLSATRLRARFVDPLDDAELALPRQTEKLMFRMQGKGGAPPSFAPFALQDADPNAPLYDVRRPLLDKMFRQLGAEDGPTFDDVTSLLRASSAFSFAFPPHTLTLWAQGTRAPDTTDFTDGGVFDNRPVGLAVEMQRWRLGVAGELASRTRYVVADPDVEGWKREGHEKDPPRPPPGAPIPLPAPPPFLATWLPFVEDFITTAFEVQIMDALEREPTMYAGLEVLPRHAPVAGAYLMEFLAFAEDDFRVFDFYMGMVDAWQQLAETSLGFQVLEVAGQGPAFVHAPELDCLLAWRQASLTGRAPPAGACAGVGLDGPEAPDPGLRPNIEALARASVETLAWDIASPPSAKPHEQGKFLAALGAAPAPYVYRQLRYHGAPADARTVDLAIREIIQRIIERTTLAQPDLVDQFAVGSVGKALANFYVYRPPAVYAAAGLVSDRGAEFLGGFRPWDPRAPHWIDGRLDGALRVIGIHMAPDDAQPGTGRTAAFTYMAAAHLSGELQLQNMSASLATLQSTVQFHLGLGWAVESLQTWNGPLLWRQGPEAVVGVAAFQRVYLDVVFDKFLDDCASNNRCSHADPYLSPTVPPVVDADWGLRFSLGYRFFVD